MLIKSTTNKSATHSALFIDTKRQTKITQLAKTMVTANQIHNNKQHSSCHLMVPCPLRLNELSPTTARVLSNCRRNIITMRKGQYLSKLQPMDINAKLVGGGNLALTTNKQQQPQLITTDLVESRRTHGGNILTTNLVNKIQLPIERRIDVIAKLQRLQRKRPIHNFTPNQMIQLVAIVVVTSIINLTQCLPDTQLASTTPSLCPLVQACLCKWSNGKQGASCERRNLQTIPMQLPADTQVLDMSGNNLNQLPQHIFQDRRLTNLQKLFLSECKISYIADEAFAQLTNLIELDLSHNFIQQVPTKSLEPLRHSLRKLSLAYNSIHVLDSAAFSSLTKLSSLDLSNNQLSQMRTNSFYGLSELRELKLNENRLSQLPMSVIGDLREFVIIDLYGNPWNCDCELRQSIDWMQRHHVQQSINPTCASPQRHKDIRWQNVKPEEFMCPPVIISKQNELVVGAGSNVTLACTARGSPPLTFVWFQDEKNLTGRGSSNQSEPPPSTKLLEEKRYEIAEELGPPNVTTSILYLINLKLTDTSLFLCWVENAAGYTLGNFSLIVNDSPPAHLSDLSTGGTINGLGNSLMRFLGLDSYDTTGTQVTIVSIGFLLLLVAAVICLLMFKQVVSGRSSKSSSHSDLKTQQANGKLSSSNKFASTNGKMAPTNRMFASSDEDGTTDDDNQSSSAVSSSSAAGSQSSCRKNNPKFLAVNDLDGFIEHMRSGIINMDYHTMSPVIQFNNTLKSSSNTNHQQANGQQQQPQQMAHLNHLPSASNASSQHPYYGVQQSNGSNSMATTLSDLSPSSGSASTSFANSNNLVIPHQQQFIATTNASINTMQRPPPMTNCDFQTQHQLGSQQEMATTTSCTSDYQSGYSGEDALISGQQQQMMPLVYDYDIGFSESQLYNQTAPLMNGQMPMAAQQLHHSTRPPSMNGQTLNIVPQVATQPRRYNHLQDSPSGFQIL